MEHTIKQLKKIAQQTQLSASEKSVMKRELLSYVKSHVARESFGVQNDPHYSFFQKFRNKKTFAGFVMGGLLLGGTVSFAAEGALPGDVLFPVKIHVNENVRGAVAISQKAKAEWEINLVERRLREIERLAVNSQVSSVAIEAAKENLTKSARKVEKRIEKFENNENVSDAVVVSSELSSVFQVHEESLNKLERKEKKSAEVSNEDHDKFKESKTITDAIGKVRNERIHAEKKHTELKMRHEKRSSDAKRTNKAEKNEQLQTVKDREILEED